MQVSVCNQPVTMVSLIQTNYNLRIVLKLCEPFCKSRSGSDRHGCRKDCLRGTTIVTKCPIAVDSNGGEAVENENCDNVLDRICNVLDPSCPRVPSWLIQVEQHGVQGSLIKNNFFSLISSAMN